MSFLLQSTIQDLFDVNVAEHDASKRMSEVLEKNGAPEEVCSYCYLILFYKLIYKIRDIS